MRPGNRGANSPTVTDSDEVSFINRPFYYRDILALFPQQPFGHGTQNRSLDVSGDQMDTGGRFPSTDEFIFRYLDHRLSVLCCLLCHSPDSFWPPEHLGPFKTLVRPPRAAPDRDSSVSYITNCVALL